MIGIQTGMTILKVLLTCKSNNSHPLLLTLPIVSMTQKATSVQTKVTWKKILLSVIHQVQVVDVEEVTIRDLEKRSKIRDTAQKEIK